MVCTLYYSLDSNYEGCCGVLSIFSSLKYCMGYQKMFLWYALLLQPTGAFFDFLDGKVARLRDKSSLLGQELDSLADLISFGMAPAALAFTLGLMTPVDALGLAFFVLSGLSRLARFNVTAAYLPKDATGKSKYFQGTPMPTTLFQCLIMSVWVWNDWYDVPPTSLLTHSKGIPLGRFGEGTWWEGHYVIAMFLLHGCAMLSRTLKVPKL